MGVTNELFQNERTIGNGRCTPNGVPEDQVFAPPDPPDSRSINSLLTTFGALGPAGTTAAVLSETSASIENFAVFMRLNAAPSQCNFNSGTSGGRALCNALDASSIRGRDLFGSVGLTPTTVSTPSAPTRLGCVLCHTDILTTGPSQNAGLDHQTFHPFSDFAIHHMGGLGDGVSQGLALGDEFRTAPLWGIGQRLFFLHDGRHPDPNIAGENALLQTILDHCIAPTSSNIPASEACGSVNLFNGLLDTTPAGTNTPSKQDVLNFLRSL